MPVDDQYTPQPVQWICWYHKEQISRYLTVFRSFRSKEPGINSAIKSFTILNG